MEKKEKKKYSKPTLTRYGKLHDIVESNTTGPNSDGGLDGAGLMS